MRRSARAQILLFSLLAKLTNPPARAAVALASYGEIAFDWSGFISQALGIAFEASRLVCIQKLLTGLKMGPVSHSACCLTDYDLIANSNTLSDSLYRSTT